MIVDSMTKLEVMKSLRSDFDKEVLPYFENTLKAYFHKEAKRLLGPQKNKIILPQRKKTSSNGICYTITCISTKIDYKCLFSTKFIYRGKVYYADLSDNESVTVYSKHSLERYAERQLKDKNIATDIVFENHIEKHSDAAFHIVLQSPTHKQCIYFGLAKALFLGDYIPDSNYGNWYNTCLSIDELHESQYRICRSLGFLCDFVGHVMFNPMPTYKYEKSSDKLMKKYLLKYPEKTADYIKFLKYSYMLCQLHLSFDFDFTEIALVKGYMDKVAVALKSYDITADELSPFDEEEGIAVQGELDYKGC